MLITNFNKTKIAGESVEDVDLCLKEVQKKLASGQQLPSFIQIYRSTHELPKTVKALPDITGAAFTLADPKYTFGPLTLDDAITLSKAHRVAVHTMRAVERTLAKLGDYPEAFDILYKELQEDLLVEEEDADI